MTTSVLHISSDDLWGGAESQLSILLQTLRDDFNKETYCSLITFNEGKLSKIHKNNESLHFIDEKKGPVYLLKECLKVARTINPDIIVSHGYKEAVIGFFTSRILQKKWIHQFHGSSESYSGARFYKSRIYSFIEKTLSRYFADKVIFVAKFVQKDCGFDNWNKSVVIHNSATKSNSSRQIPDNSIIKIAVVGRIAPVKRIDLAIDAFAIALNSRNINLPRIELHIAGSGPLLKEMTKRAQNLNLLNKNIFFHGFIEDINSFLLNTSLILMTSDSEGLPTILLEAAHLGIPIISREVGGIKEIKENLAQYPLFLVPSSDTKDIAKTIYDILDKNFLFESNSNFNTDYFNSTRMAQEHNNLYKNLMKN
jgi:glycosyltransferase involved in cell wall biosynthesis